jgi:hypothetical protein
MDAIGDFAFAGCWSLTKVTVPAGCRVGLSVFLHCPGRVQQE